MVLGGEAQQVSALQVTELYKLDTEFLLTKTNGISGESMRFELVF